MFKWIEKQVDTPSPAPEKSHPSTLWVKDREPIPCFRFVELPFVFTP